MKGCDLAIKRGAIFDNSGRYRYSLSRLWRANLPHVVFVMLNPNQADELSDDPTITRCIGLADAHGFGSLTVVNLFAFKAKTPELLRHARDPVGRLNDSHIEEAARRADKMIVAWGNHGSFQERDEEVLSLLLSFGDLYCFGKTKLNMPKHPLYLPGKSPLCHY